MRLSDREAPLVTFDALPYERPDAAFLDDLFRKTRLRLHNTRQTDTAVQIVRDFEEAWLFVRSAFTLATLRRAQGDRAMRDEVTWFSDLETTLLTSRAAMLDELPRRFDQAALREALGRDVLRVARRLPATVRAAFSTRLNEDTRLCQRLSRTRDRATRGHIWDQLITLRVALAREAGFDSYRDYAAARYDRPPDDQSRRERFYDAVTRWLVPLCREARACQHARLYGDERVLMAADGDRLFAHPWRAPDVSLETLSAVLNAVVPPLGDRLKRQWDAGYVNTDARAARRLPRRTYGLPTAETTYLNVGSVSSERFLPSLFRAVGEATVNESAFYERRRVLVYEAPLLWRELFSGAFVHLTAPRWSLCLPRYGHLAYELDQTRRLLSVPRRCALDAFEEALYNHPTWSCEQRARAWQALVERFMPDEAGWASDWRDIDGAHQVPFSHLEGAWADVMLWASVPYGPRFEKDCALVSTLRRLATSEQTDDPLDGARQAGFWSPIDDTSMRLSATTIALVLGL